MGRISEECALGGGWGGRGGSGRGGVSNKTKNEEDEGEPALQKRVQNSIDAKENGERGGKTGNLPRSKERRARANGRTA